MSIQFNLRTVGAGVFKFDVLDANNRALATYNIIDYSDDMGCMYVVQREEDISKQIWTADFIEAQNICKVDYNSRIK